MSEQLSTNGNCSSFVFYFIIIYSNVKILSKCIKRCPSNGVRHDICFTLCLYEDLYELRHNNLCLHLLQGFHCCKHSTFPSPAVQLIAGIVMDVFTKAQLRRAKQTYSMIDFSDRRL